MALKNLQAAELAAKSPEVISGAKTVGQVMKEAAAGGAAASAATKAAPGLLSKVTSVAGKASGAIEVGTAAYDMYDVLSGGTSIQDWNEGNKKMDWLDYLSPWKVSKKVGAEGGELINKGLSAVSGSATSLGSKLYDLFSSTKAENDMNKAVPLEALAGALAKADVKGTVQQNSGDLAAKTETVKLNADNVRIEMTDKIQPPQGAAERSTSVLVNSKSMAAREKGNSVTFNQQNNVTTGGGVKSGMDMPIVVSPARSQENAFQRYQLRQFAPY
jgi:hypothetical protein